MNIVYADNNATTPIAPEVVEAMTPFLTTEYFNPSSMYDPAMRVAKADLAGPSGNRTVLRTVRSERDRVHQLRVGKQ